MIIYENLEKTKNTIALLYVQRLEEFLNLILSFFRENYSSTYARSILRRKFSGNSTKRLAQFSRTSGLINRIKPFPLDLPSPSSSRSSKRLFFCRANIREHYGLPERRRDG